jgi:hypothetical protein
MPRLLGELGFGDDLVRFDEDDPCTRRVVRRVLARRPETARRRDRDRVPEHRFEVLTRHPARSQDARHLARDVDDGRLDADLAGAAVQDEVDGVTELRPDVAGGGGAD